ncbi:MAG: ATP-dependent Clp protease proteolytic subunit [Elusimicrobia bacterium]|nr:ATP-dependent Clp protease proteolytic subunit [Elusimicrobiota bacterium]
MKKNKLKYVFENTEDSQLPHSHEEENKDFGSLLPTVDFENRTIYLIGEIEEKMLTWLIPVFSMMDESGKDPIIIRLSSHGGDIYVGMAIHDMIRHAKNNVIVEVFGYAFSIAAIILQAADLRVITENSEIMLHDGSITLSENIPINSNTLNSHTQNLNSLKDKICSIISKRSKIPLNKTKSWLEGETFFTAKEAYDNKLVDQVWRNSAVRRFK